MSIEQRILSSWALGFFHCAFVGVLCKHANNTNTTGIVLLAILCGALIGFALRRMS